MRHWLYVSLFLTILTFAGTFYVAELHPELMADPVPVHWNINGAADAFVPRAQATPYLMIIPLCMFGMCLLTVLLPWLSPRPFGVERFRDTYYYIMGLVVALFAYIQALLLLASLRQPPVNTTRLMIAGIFLFFALMGNSLGKVRRNFWMGVRTPWTLASEVVWDRTHRVAAWLFTAVGAAGFVAVLVGVPFVVCFVVLITAALVPVVYSLVLYKRLEREGKLSPSAEPSQEVHVP
jgi:uncharacterized membrane protein